MSRALIYAQTVPWALTEEAFQQLLAIADREKLSAEETFARLEALAGKLGKPIQNTRESYVRDGVGVVPVVGPIFRYANLFTALSGATSSERLAQDLTSALNDPNVKSILLEVNSPGGEVAGVNELSKMVAAASEIKPVVAYVGGLAQSGGYWIASAAGEIVVDETALLGSIGVVVNGRDNSERDKQNGAFEIVSSQSPNKRVNPSTDAGRATLQAMVDELADVFIAAVAANRNVEPAKVAADFGRGGSLIGASAVTAGMADRVGSFESVLAEMSSGSSRTSYSFSGNAAAKGKAENNMKTPTTESAAEPVPAAPETTQAPCAACKTSAATAIASERTRIAAIVNHAEAAGRENLARTLAFESDMTAESAAKILAVAPKASAAPSNPLANAMAGIPNPPVGPGAGASADSEDPKVLGKQIAAFANGK